MKVSKHFPQLVLPVEGTVALLLVLTASPIPGGREGGDGGRGMLLRDQVFTVHYISVLDA